MDDSIGEDMQTGGTKVDRLLREAESRIRAHMEENRGHSRGFIASDFTVVNSALERLVEERVPRGTVFCEWGSGFGVVTMLASLLGFDGFGIEMQAELVLASEALASEFECDVHFAHGSFLTADDEDLFSAPEQTCSDAGPDGYQELDLASEDVDLFFAYPWPGEVQSFDTLFQRQASIGALLLTYHDGHGILVQRKSSHDGELSVVGWY